MADQGDGDACRRRSSEGLALVATCKSKPVSKMQFLLLLLKRKRDCDADFVC